MAFPATTMLQLLVLITWACLLQPVHKNGLFKQFFFDQAVLSEICSAASLCFCPGLFEAIQAVHPPDVSFFRRLPSDGSGRWAVYALVLDKPGALPLIYIGSGTDMKRGVPARWAVYNKPEANRPDFPKYVQRALDDGYKISHKGLLVWCSIPSAENAPRFRLLFVAIEAALSFLFWTMKSKVKDYGMHICCPWPRDSFSYGGLCSHNALTEMVAGNFDLSGEQLEAIAAEIKEKNRLYQAKYSQDLKAKDPESLTVRMREANARYNKNSHDKALAKGQRHSAKAKASRRYYCDVCELECTKKYEFERHNASRRHLNNVEKAKSGVVKKYRCDVCSYSCTKPSHLETHKLGKRHRQRVAEAST